MISKARLKELASFRLPKKCDELAVYVAEGTKMATEAVAAGADLRTCCATAAWLAQNGRLAVRFAEIEELSEADFERLSLQKSPCGVWMLIGRPQPQPIPTEAPLVLALDHLQDPGNLGTIMRTADWFGIRHIVCSADNVSPFNPKAVQSSMGAVFRTNVVRVGDLATWLAASGRTVCGADLEGTSVYTAPLPKLAALVVGNESQGLSDPVRRTLGQRLTIPNVGGTAESLNAASATAILCSEFYRHHHQNLQ
ncbi:MAG: RNA methyltransferase [Bacteroidales bacterium]|nr:RNA methyltransferase [Bacteroidales bacterium]